MLLINISDLLFSSEFTPNMKCSKVNALKIAIKDRGLVR